MAVISMGNFTCIRVRKKLTQRRGKIVIKVGLNHHITCEQKYPSMRHIDRM